MSDKILNHEESYKKGSISSIIHNNRLDFIKEIFKNHVSGTDLEWSDFGCSTGFIIEEIANSNMYDFSKIMGFDYVGELLEIAKEKNISNTDFNVFDMNKVSTPEAKHDLITCFETLEHVGNLKSAIENLFIRVKPGGLVIITIPNETGIPGLIKLLARSILRKNAYDDFFDDKSYLQYSVSLLKNDLINDYRDYSKPAHGPHLGFDYRIFEKIVGEFFIDQKKFDLIEKNSTNFNMNLFYVYRRLE